MSRYSFSIVIDTKHIIVSKDMTLSPITFKCLNEIQKSLNKIEQHVFPLPVYENNQADIIIDGVDIVIAEPNMCIDVVPKIKISPLSVKQSEPIMQLNEPKDIKCLTAITLGTGAAMPLKYRNGMTITNN